jgi:hypothetical protein
MSLQAESVADQWPRAMQFALPVRPVVRTWPVEVNLCVQAELLYAAGECPVFCSDRGFDGVLIGAGSVEWADGRCRLR